MSNFSLPLGAIYLLFLQADYDEPIINYAKVMVPEFPRANFGISLTNTFDIDGNGEDRMRGIGVVKGDENFRGEGFNGGRI